MGLVTKVTGKMISKTDLAPTNGVMGLPTSAGSRTTKCTVSARKTISMAKSTEVIFAMISGKDTVNWFPPTLCT